MGNNPSSPSGGGNNNKDVFVSFPGSALVDALNCGGLDDTEDTPRSNKTGSNETPHKTLSQFFSRINTEELCAMSPANSGIGGVNTEFNDEYEEFRPRNTIEEQDALLMSHSRQTLSMSRSQSPHALQTPSPSGSSNNNTSSKLFAKALVSEVTDNPKTMTPAAMAEREKRLLKAQEKARNVQKSGDTSGPRPVGTPGGVGKPCVLGSIAHVLTGNVDAINAAATAAARNGGLGTTHEYGRRDPPSSILPPNSLSENRAAQEYNNSTGHTPMGGKFTVTIGLSLSRRSSKGHPDTVTRQTAFDFNELQDRDYNKAGIPSSNNPGTPNAHENYKVAAPDTVHIPIIHIDADSPQAVDSIISALASGEVFIPHMAIIPEALSVNGVSPPDLVVRFGTERNEDLPPDEWPNWCLEFMHNQLYEYFQGMGARWMKRPFSITLARKVRWKTVKHMNRYFAHAERVIDAWREKGPQYLDPQLAYIEGGATPEEVARPHGIYLLRNGVPTNYFAPNFDPPYTTKMTRSLLFNVLGKSWDKKRREWTSQPIPRLVTPSMLVTAMCGCTENQVGGFVATEATMVDGTRSSKDTILPEEAAIRSAPPPREFRSISNEQPPVTVNESGKISPQMKSDTSSGKNQSFVSLSSKSAFRDHKETQFSGNNPNKKDDELTADEGIDNCLELQMSKSYDNIEANNTSCDSKSNTSTSTSKYGRPPTPEEIHHPPQRRSLESSSNRDNATEGMNRQQAQEEEKENGNPSKGTEKVLNCKLEVYDDSLSSSSAMPRTILPSKVSSKNVTKLHQQKEASSDIIDEKKEDPPLRNMASDEDWLDEVGKPIATPRSHPYSDDDIMASLERESKKHLELIALAQQKTAVTDKKPGPLHVLAGAMLEEALSQGTKSSSPSFRGAPAFGPCSPSHRKSSSARSRSPTSLRKIDSGTSGISLEYSVDSTLLGESSIGGSTLNSTVGGSTVGSSLLGHHYAADGSIISSATRATVKEGIMQDVVHEASGSGEESQDSGEEIIPSDEELYAVGWAKAFDQNSGSYYYFTLDRSKIVWENPLDPPDVAQSKSEDSLFGANPDRAAAI
ncbi:hypothetical protein IV203_004171 [Nitzschia inconspicua]|uniref:WW domain-containing protein n=1 Tax=Nitzschia inconspicua TaxID=303405 RepID=A0A9K3L365_9STRA|nr:hypothetical protein IV203_004171 [Nitzschia inconspicua]